MRSVAVTRLLEKALAEAAKLPPADQDALARWLMEDILAEQRWQKTFARSQDALAKLADEALAEYDRGETEPLDPESL